MKAHAFVDGNKRTGALAAVTFLNQHGMDVVYPIDKAKDINGFAQVIDDCAASVISKENPMDWFDYHKTYLED